MILISGLFSLEPVMLSYLNSSLKLNAEKAKRNSPVLLKPVVHCPLLLITGMDESNEFKDQSTEIYSYWKHELSNINLLTVPGKNHYSILETVAEQDSFVQSAIFRLMNIKTQQP